MIFRSRVVKDYILNGANYVATVRKATYKEGQWISIDLGSTRLRGKVVKVVPIDDARKYVHISGFKSVEEWLAEARRLHRVDNLEGFVIVVVKIERKSNQARQT